MSKHTPGPWMVTDSEGDVSLNGGVSIGIDDAFGQDGGRDYCLATVVHGDPDELRANAELVAAAPELLAALEEMMEYRPCNQLGAVTHRARAVIAKAKGIRS